MNCPSCASPVPEEARFCPSCGHLLRGSEERRIVTVLFADLVGFTALGELRDPEQLKLLVDRCFERLVADITAFGGSVDKIVGDAIVALFGAPLAHEDDPERAVRAALRMQRTVAEVSADLDTSIQMRIGINTGEVLVGALRAGGDYTAMGDTVNLAARLETTAAPGEVLVGPDTYEATSEVVRYVSRGTMAVRGREGAIAVHVATEELTLPGRRPRPQRAPLVGRDSEIRLLGSAIDAAVDREHAHLILIPGEAGQGKTRLAEEVALQAELEHDALVLEGRCLPYGETSPWWPIAEAIRQFFGVSPVDPPSTVRERIDQHVASLVGEDDRDAVAAGLSHLLGVEELGAPIERSRARDDALDALYRYLAAMLEQRPVIILISDVHWADAQMLEVAERMLVSLRSQPFVVIATTRWSGDDERWVAQTGRHNTVICNLLPLDRGATARLAAALLGTDVSAELAADLYERTGGNPFFLEELVYLLSDSAAAMPADDTGPIMTELPDTLRGLVSARLDALTSEQRRMVQDAAVIGRDGPVYALVLMAQESDDPAPEHTFSQLVAKDIFETVGSGWRFRSDLVREVAYGTLTKAARAQQHAGIGEWLEAHPEKSDLTLRTASRIAHHFYTAASLAVELGSVAELPSGLRERALASLERAASLAEQADSNYAAGKAYARILDLAEDEDLPRRLRALLGRAAVRLDLRELAGARIDGEAARSLAAEHADEAGEAQALTLLSEVHVLEGDVDGARVAIDDSISRWRHLGDDAGLAEAFRQSGFISMRQGARIDAELSFRAALDIYRANDDRAGEGWCLQNLAWLAFEQGAVEVADEYLSTSMQLFREVGDIGGIGWASGLMAYVRFYQGKTDEAEELATHTLSESERRGEPWATGMMQVLLASISLWSGRVREAIERAGAANEQLDRIEDDYGRVQSLGVLARALLAGGRTTEAYGAFDEAERIARSMPHGPLVEFAQVVRLSALVQCGDAVGAARIVEQLPTVDEVGQVGHVGHVDREVAVALTELQTGTGDPAARLDRLAGESAPGAVSANLVSALALARAVAGATDEAVALADSIEPNSSTFVDRRTAQIAAGLAAARAGDQDASIDRFERALMEVDGTGSRLSQAVVRVARAIGYAALELPEAPELAAEANRRANDLELDLAGWRRVFTAAVGSGRSPMVSGST
ncbi:MAG: adenylate/guanylate cyclase domain-containing protein [Actinomycetota bacterium]